MANNATNIEVEERVEKVALMLSRFMNRRQILQYVSKKTDWNVSDRMVDEYISRGKELLKKHQDPEVLKGKIRSNLEELYSKNLSIDDYKECRALLESMAKIFGINEPEKIQNNHSFDDFDILRVVGFSDDKTE